MIRFKQRRVVVSVVVVAAIASAVTMIVKNHGARQDDVSGDRLLAQTSQGRARPLVSPLVPEQQRSLAAIVDEPAAALLAQVEHKYRFLIADVEKEHVDELRRRLLERESKIDVNSRARIDAGIGKLLPAESFAYYQRLKDSDLEQRHLTEYTGGISNAAPLDERQERLVLDAKLRQKQRHAAAVGDIGFDRESLSNEERAYAHARTAEALELHMEDFLAEVAPLLTHEQYTQLKNFEAAELARELNRLQQRIDPP